MGTIENTNTLPKAEQLVLRTLRSRAIGWHRSDDLSAEIVGSMRRCGCAEAALSIGSLMQVLRSGLTRDLDLNCTLP